MPSGSSSGTSLEQAASPNLAAIAAVTPAANKVIYFTGATTAAVTDLTTAGIALINGASAAAQRTSLGLGSAALLASTAFDASGAAATAQAAAIAASGVIPTVYDSFGSGTAYSLTNTAAAVVFGTTSPSIQLDIVGVYRIKARVNLKLNAATMIAARTVTLKLRRTNNTAADIANSTTAVITAVTTTLTGTFMEVTWEVPYTTQGAGDVLTIFASMDTVPSAGSLDVSEAHISAMRVA